MGESDLKQKEIELKQKETELKYKEIELNIQQIQSSVDQLQFDREINRQELLRRAIEIASNAYGKVPRAGLETLLTKASEKLISAIEAL